MQGSICCNDHLIQNNMKKVALITGITGSA